MKFVHKIGSPGHILKISVLFGGPLILATHIGHSEVCTGLLEVLMSHLAVLRGRLEV